MQQWYKSIYSPDAAYMSVSSSVLSEAETQDEDWQKLLECVSNRQQYELRTRGKMMDIPRFETEMLAAGFRMELLNQEYRCRILKKYPDTRPHWEPVWLNQAWCRYHWTDNTEGRACVWKQRGGCRVYCLKFNDAYCSRLLVSPHPIGGPYPMLGFRVSRRR